MLPWASKYMGSPLTLLHIARRRALSVRARFGWQHWPYWGSSARAPLGRSCPVYLDRKRAELALEHGNHMLDEAAHELQNTGLRESKNASAMVTCPSHCWPCKRKPFCWVMGLNGESSYNRDRRIKVTSSNGYAEVWPANTLMPNHCARSAMLAFDGSATAWWR